MPLEPLPQSIITADKLRRQAKELILLAEELEASAGQGRRPTGGTGVFLFGEVSPKRRRKK